MCHELLGGPITPSDDDDSRLALSRAQVCGRNLTRLTTTGFTAVRGNPANPYSD